MAALVAQVALAGRGATTGPKSGASAGVNKQLKKLKSQLSQLRQQVAELSRQPGPQGGTGAQG
ncbi:MAG: hypothetical protein ACRDL6_03505, partial [Solirubrobacterales bacterium]